MLKEISQEISREPMDKYERIAALSSSEFRRLTGVKPETFQVMLRVYQRNHALSKRVSGRPSVLSQAEQILMMLEYSREYRTYFHVAQSYGISESTCYKIIKRVESLLISSGEFSLPKKTALYGTQTLMEALVVDVTEVTVQRPKKNKSSGTRASTNTITSKSRW